MRVAVLGCGAWGSRVAKRIEALGHSVTAFDFDVAKAKDLALDSYAIGWVEHPLAALRSADAAVIATPPHAHLDGVRLAASRVERIRVEKPMAHSFADADEMVRVAGDRLTVAHTPLNSRATDYLAGVLAGAHTAVQACFRRFTFGLPAHASETSALWDLSSHDVALALRLFGPAYRVQGRGSGFTTFHAGATCDFYAGWGDRSVRLADFCWGGSEVLYREVEGRVSGHVMGVPVQEVFPTDDLLGVELGDWLAGRGRVSAEQGRDVVEVLSQAQILADQAAA